MKNKIERGRVLDGAFRVSDPFWSPKLDTFVRVTLPDTFDKFETDGTLANYENLIKGALGTHRGNPFHDGLFLETIRGASDYLAARPDPALVRRIDKYVDIIERAQLASGGGYLSTYTQLQCPEQRYGENGGSILHQHDLYNHGALFEAGVHFYQATGHIKLLECALRGANELCAVIGDAPKKCIVPGHSLPEYALLELYELLRDKPEIARETDVPVRTEAYRALADFWVRARGRHARRTNNPQYMGEYAQDHAPIGEQFQAVGHAVRATLFYTGATRLSMLEGDENLLCDSLRLWQNVTERKLHISGGVGATHFEEKFGADYDLVNTAYLETCAAAGLIFWGESLGRATGEARFYHVVERALYNVMLSSVSLQGDSYFYRNPLCSKGDDHHWAWHGCPCCPPMIHKIFGMFDRLAFTQDDAGVYANLLAGGTLRARLAAGEIALRAETELPWEGSYRVYVTEAAAPFALRVRVPDWARSPRFFVNGERVNPETVRGYALFTARAGDVIELRDPLSPVRIEAHPYVRCDRGRVAMARGPLVYCVEGVDNGGDADFTLAENPRLTAKRRPDLLGGVTVLQGKTNAGKSFTAVPLYAWDNRMAGAMGVWLRQAGKDDGWDTAGWEGKLYRPYE